MTGIALHDVLQFARLYRARQRQQTAMQRTQREMNLLPKHLLDDVNALGLPMDPALTKRARYVSANSSRNFITPIRSITLIDG
ncbi:MULTISPECIES: hypothetical protein [unclassified Sinorhizobium]|uniref:hypothetical protein n=1 Tax=unclassified Sinorhizobium TaxID=2613772 RepID=UPI00352326AA